MGAVCSGCQRVFLPQLPAINSGRLGECPRRVSLLWPVLISGLTQFEIRPLSRGPGFNYASRISLRIQSKRLVTGGL
jgi:hypothetical protein